ncbi:unnamed protein product [Rangifer tarandus platyrhynchus]|uniref:Uncharacterized protein n=1 Tax=Rangifer tarandus platyrhynchus TaxID=3082113 RepID=A0AC59YIL8_RANTA
MLAADKGSEQAGPCEEAALCQGEYLDHLVPASVVCGASCPQEYAGNASCLETGDPGPGKVQRNHLPPRRAKPGGSPSHRKKGARVAAGSSRLPPINKWKEYQPTPDASSFLLSWGENPTALAAKRSRRTLGSCFPVSPWSHRPVCHRWSSLSPGTCPPCWRANLCLDGPPSSSLDQRLQA